jgi:hypothetical protein
MKRNQFVEVESAKGLSRKILPAGSAAADRPVVGFTQPSDLDDHAWKNVSEAKVIRISVVTPPEHANNPEQIVIHFAHGPFPNLDA